MQLKFEAVDHCLVCCIHAGRTVALQLGSRLIRDGDFRLNFAAAAAFNAVGLLATLCLRESLATSSKKRLSLRKLGNPLGFISFFNRSPALRSLVRAMRASTSALRPSSKITPSINNISCTLCACC